MAKAFQKEISGNRAGRKPGIPDKATTVAREAFAAGSAGGVKPTTGEGIPPSSEKRWVPKRAPFPQMSN